MKTNNGHSYNMTARLEDYLNYLLLERNLSNSTVKLKRSMISPFIRFLDGRDITQASVREYIYKLGKGNAKPDTINVFIQCVFGFTDYLTANDQGDYSTIRKIKRLTIKPSLPEYLTVDEMRDLIHAPSDNHFKRRKVWDALFLLLAVTALRISEATGLTWKNIVQNNGQFWIHIRNGKTGDRTILLPTVCYQIFDLRYGQPLVFTNRFGQRITPNAANEELKVRATHIGLNKCVHCHLFRHGALTYYASKGKTTHELAALSGHTKSSTLDKYVHLSGYDTKWLESSVAL